MGVYEYETIGRTKVSFGVIELIPLVILLAIVGIVFLISRRNKVIKRTRTRSVGEFHRFSATSADLLGGGSVRNGKRVETAHLNLKILKPH